MLITLGTPSFCSSPDCHSADLKIMALQKFNKGTTRVLRAAIAMVNDPATGSSIFNGHFERFKFLKYGIH
jgi:hypothetical protein